MRRREVVSQAEKDAAEYPWQAWQAGRQADREEKVLEKNSVIAIVPCRKPLPLQQKA